jgi:hypothetical protein
MHPRFCDEAPVARIIDPLPFRRRFGVIGIDIIERIVQKRKTCEEPATKPTRPYMETTQIQKNDESNTKLPPSPEDKWRIYSGMLASSNTKYNQKLHENFPAN